MEKLMLDFLSLTITLTLTGFVTLEDKSMNFKEDSEPKQEVVIKNESVKESKVSTETKRIIDNKSKVRMVVNPMIKGETAYYDVDNYVRASGTAGASNNFYYVLNNKLYHVNAANPALSTQYATGVEFVTWDAENEVALAIVDENYRIVNNQSNTDKFISYLHINKSKNVQINSMDGNRTPRAYDVDNYARGIGTAGASNNYYYVKDKNLYYVSAANPEKRILVATGVEYVAASDNGKIGSFIALVNDNFTYVNKNEAYSLRVINIEKYLKYKNNENK